MNSLPITSPEFGHSTGPSTGPVWVCIPTYNEAENVVPLVTCVVGELERAGLDGHVLVIDDNSPDGTGALAEAVARQEPRVDVLHRAGKAGLGPAYQAGFRRALDRGAEVVVEMDCDFSHDPAAVADLVAALEGADVAIGSRYVPGARVDNWGRARELISRGGCWYARMVLGVPVHDVTGGFRAFRRHAAEALAGSDLRASGYGFQIEGIYRVLERGLRLVEVPIRFTDRVRGASKMSFGIVLEAAWLVIRLRLGRVVGGLAR